MRRAFLGVFSSRGCLHTGFWAKGRHCGPHPVKNDRSLRHWGSRTRAFSAVLCARSRTCGLRDAEYSEICTAPPGLPVGKSNRPAEICNRQDGLCNLVAVGASVARYSLNPRTGYSALLKAPSNPPKRDRFIFGRFYRGKRRATIRWPGVCPVLLGMSVVQCSYWPIQCCA
jgi:hypothetical protein